MVPDVTKNWWLQALHLQMQRTLRDHVVLEAELVTASEDGRPYVEFTAGNMGQTHVHLLHSLVKATSRRVRCAALPSRGFMRFDCAAASRALGAQRRRHLRR